MSGITMASACGESGASVQLTDRSYQRVSSYPNAAYCGIMLSSDGLQYLCQNTTGTFTSSGYSWLLSGSAASYDASLTLNGQHPTWFVGPTAFDIPSTLASGAWGNLATTRRWGYYIASGVVLEKGMTGTLAIRPAGGGANLVTATINLFASTDV